MKPRLDIRFTCKLQHLYWFGKVYEPLENEFLLNHNRNGITLALQVALSQGSKVGVMAYNCHTVANAVLQAGCKPIFLDVTNEMRLDLTDLHRKVAMLDGLIVTHLFGIRNNMQEIRAVCPQIILVEDCAHTYGIEGVGEYSDFVTYSIGQAKLPSIGDGGILISNPRWTTAVQKAYELLPEYTLAQRMKLFIRMFGMSILYRPLVYTVLTKPLLKKDRGAGNARTKEYICRMARGIRAIYAVEKDNVSAQINAREMNVKRLSEQLSLIPGIQRTIIGENAFMLVAWCDNPNDVIEALRIIGIEAATHFKYTIEWAKQMGYQSGDCPQAEDNLKHVVMIPTY